ncbi:MAG TPA: tetratricopeptide repeat protein [Ktedonobacterales bacterium]|nr:tetratricopeptide repeat protein [Ktedonobacterales bacterium]
MYTTRAQCTTAKAAGGRARGCRHNPPGENTWAASEAMRHLTDYTEGDECLRYALRSLELREEMRFTCGLPPAQLLVSAIYIARGEWAQALKYCQQARQLAEELGLRVHLMYALLTQGEIEYTQGRLAEAREYLEKSSALAHELNTARGIAATDEKLAMLAGEQKADGV